MRQAGVYTILNLVTGRRYIGSSIDIPKRWGGHLSALNKGTNANLALQADWVKYGATAFSWNITERCDTRAEAIAAEQRHIDAHQDIYNAARRAGSGPPDGFKHTPETVARMSAALKGRKKSEAHKAALSAAKRGKPCPAQSIALKGRKLSPEHSAAIGRGNTGKRHSAEHKAYMSALMKGRDTSGWSWKMAATKRGIPWSVDRWHAFALKHY